MDPSRDEHDPHPYWEDYFELIAVKDAHARSRCRDQKGTEPWACCDCDCTERLERWLESQGEPFRTCSNYYVHENEMADVVAVVSSWFGVPTSTTPSPPRRGCATEAPRAASSGE